MGTYYGKNHGIFVQIYTQIEMKIFDLFRSDRNSIFKISHVWRFKF